MNPPTAAPTTHDHTAARPSAATAQASVRALTDGRRAATVVAHRELLRQVKQPGALVAQALQMVFFLLVYAVGFGSQIPRMGGLNFAAFVFPGLVAINVVTTGISAGMTYAWDREYGFTREMFVAPVPRIAIPLGKALGVTIQATAQAAVLLLIAPVVGVAFGVLPFLLGVGTAALTAGMFCLLGLFLATAVRKADVLQGVVQLVMYPLLFLSGSVFTPTQAPSWLRTAMQVNPMTYAVDLLRQALLLQQPAAIPRVLPAWADLVVLTALSVVLLAGLRAKVGR